MCTHKVGARGGDLFVLRCQCLSYISIIFSNIILADASWFAMPVYFLVLKFWILCQGYVLSVQTIKTSPPIITYNWYRKLDHEAFFICVISKIIIINCFPSNTNHDLPLSTVSPPQQTASRASSWNTSAATLVEFLSTEAMPSFSSGEMECRM